MLQKILKLNLNKTQTKTLNDWLFYSKNIYNWAIAKMNYNVKNEFFFTEFDIINLLSGHSKRLGMPTSIIRGVLYDAYLSWERCFKKLAKKPRFKSHKNPMTSMLVRQSIKSCNVSTSKIKFPIIEWLKFFKENIPAGKVKQARFIKKASGWHVGLFIDAEPTPVTPLSSGSVGIDTGYKTHLSLSTGEKIDFDDTEYKRLTARIAQAQKGGNKKLVARLHEKRANVRKQQDHILSKKLVESYDYIAMPKDNIQKISKEHGKSAAKASHHRLRRMIAYKAKGCARSFVEVESAYTSMTCSECGERHELTLSDREWACVCGAHHDRDINAAKNILNWSYRDDKKAQKLTATTTRRKRAKKSL